MAPFCFVTSMLLYIISVPTWQMTKRSEGRFYKEAIAHVENAWEGSTEHSTSEGEGKTETSESSSGSASSKSRDTRVAQNFRYSLSKPYVLLI